MIKHSRLKGSVPKIFLLLTFFVGCEKGLSLSPNAMYPGDVNSAISAPGLSLDGLIPAPQLTIYLVAGSDPVSARLTVRRGSRLEGDRLMIRAFNPDEALSFWQYIEPGQLRNHFNPGNDEVWGIPLNTPAQPRSDDLFADVDIPLQGEGVHQIRVTAGSKNSVAALRLSAEVPYALSFQNGTFSAWKGQPDRLYLYVPPHAEELKIAGGPVKIFDETGAEVLSSTTDKLSTINRVPVSRTSVVWRVEFPNVEQWQLRAGGFPFLLCSTKESAEAIHASIEELPDGTVVAWKFQRRIAALLPGLLAPENVGKAEELIVPLSSRREAWLKEPEKNSLLANPYALFANIEESLRSQNVDPTSHWGGTIGGWQDRIGKATPENRWDRLTTVPGLWAGTSPRNGAAAENLAQAALFDSPLNPYYGKKELLNRAAAAALRDLMTLGEDEAWRGVEADLDPYPGMMSFPVGQKTMPVYAATAPQMPLEIRSAWTEGVRHIVDRGFPDDLVSARNQASHFLLAYEEFAKGSGDPRYEDLARSYAKRFADGTHPAGFQIESAGPDGSYIGMTHWHMALYYRKSHDPVILDALRKSYNFFNHTVAPEPDGQMLGGFNFNHRIGTGFYNEQWEGARGILDDVLPQVGLWSGTAERKKQAAAAVSNLQNWLDHPKKPGDLGLTNVSTPRYSYWQPANRAGIWPALERGSFTRNFANELIAIKRPAYYATVYVGKPAPVPHYIAKRESLRVPFPEDAENRGGTITARQVTPFLGGGLSLLWSEDYGASLLATNWSPLTHHGMVATQADGKRYWEDYFSTNFSLDKNQSQLVVSGKLENIPIRYERRYRLDDEELGIELILTADADIKLQALHENIPLAFGIAKSGKTYIRAIGEKNGKAHTDSVRVEGAMGAGVEIKLDEPQPLSILRDGLRDNRIQVARLEIPLPMEFKAGQVARLHYILRPIKPSVAKDH